MNELPAFLGIATLIIVTPGQDTALTIQSTVAGGRPNGLSTAAGVASGQAVWTVVAGIGLSALIASSEALFVVLRLVGAAYLVFLGSRAIWAAWHESGSSADQSASHRRVDPVGAYAQGLLSNLSNPKMLVFFTSLLPQFASQLSGFLTLGLAFCAMTLIWLSAYALVLSRLRKLFDRQIVRRAVEGLTGSVLVSLGVRIALEAR